MRIVRPGKRTRVVVVEAIPNVLYRFDIAAKKPEIVVELSDGKEKLQVLASLPEWQAVMAMVLMKMQENTP